MKSAFWLLLCAFAAAVVWIAWYIVRKSQERRRAEEERIAKFIAGTAAAAPVPAASPPASLAAVPAEPAPAATNGLAQQKLLFEAAHKAGEAGEPALAIQLYGRLLARYPASAFAGEVHAAVEALKKKRVKA
jgi:hypothetical protein